MKYYTGVGSRETPIEILLIFEQIGKYLANKNNFYNEYIDEMEKSIGMIIPLNYLHDNDNSNERKEMK